MCDHDAKQPFATHFSKKPLDAPAVKFGSRRRRLWDLSADCHCPVIGVCLPIALLLKSVNKALGGTAVADDYELHVGAVNECRSRNRVSEILQRELDARHAIVVRKFKLAKSTDALMKHWRQAVAQGDVSGALWAALTHPCCDAQLQEQLCREIHMIQHQAGARVQADLCAMDALLSENAVLGRELAKVQERTTRLVGQKNAEIEALHADLMKLRATLIAKDSSLDFLQDELIRTRAMVPELEARERLAEKVSRLQARIIEQDNRIATLRQQWIVKESGNAESEPCTACEETNPSVSPASAKAVNLAKKTVLCVGGRSSSIPKYRSIIEEYGGEYLHHDGGLEENMGRLIASIAAADLIICQTGCVSHDAYWRVKDHCKRTGKQCIYVENPSPSSLSRTLSQAIKPIPLVEVRDDQADN